MILIRAAYRVLPKLRFLSHQGSYDSKVISSSENSCVLNYEYNILPDESRNRYMHLSQISWMILCLNSLHHVNQRFPKTLTSFLVIYSCVVVEDSAIGLAAAKAAGMKCIVTKSG